MQLKATQLKRARRREERGWSGLERNHAFPQISLQPSLSLSLCVCVCLGVPVPIPVCTCDCLCLLLCSHGLRDSSWGEGTTGLVPRSFLHPPCREPCRYRPVGTGPRPSAPLAGLMKNPDPYLRAPGHHLGPESPRSLFHMEEPFV